MFALVAALEQGVPPEAVFAAPDRLVVARHDRGPAWRVANYEGHGFGRATLRTATALSINTVYARLLLRLGGGDADREPRAVVEAAARMGVGSPLRAVPSAVLGTGEVTRWRWPARTPPWPPGAAGGAVRGDPDHRARRPRPVPGQIRRRPGGQPGPWPRSPPTCSEGWSTAAPGAGSAGPPPARPAPSRTMPTPGSWASPDAGHGGVGRLPAGAGADGAAKDREPGLGRDLAGGDLVPVHARGAGRRAHGRFPRPDLRLVQLTVDLKRGCLPNRFTPAAEVASVVT
jgi:hypothetical protein